METENITLSLTDSLIVACILLTGLALLSPAVVHSREENRLLMCQNKMRKHVLGVLNRESATRRFPLAMFGKRASVKIDRRHPEPFSEQDGYSWAVAILPYSDQVELFDRLSEASRQFTEEMNSDKLKADAKYLHSVTLDDLLCPTTDESQSKTRGKYPGLDDAQVSNYMSLTAGCVDGSRGTYGDVNPTTGGMIVTKQASPKGLKVGDCKDGFSKTLLFSESKAELYSYWYSGASTATISMPPDLVQCSRIARNRPDGYPAPKTGIPSAVNYGRDHDALEGKPFAENYPGGLRDWGTSSRHVGGQVVHGFVDGHAAYYTKKVDPTAYFRLTTRGGAEPLDLAALQEAAAKSAQEIEEAADGRGSGEGSSDQ